MILFMSDLFKMKVYYYFNFVIMFLLLSKNNILSYCYRIPIPNFSMFHHQKAIHYYTPVQRCIYPTKISSSYNYVKQRIFNKYTSLFLVKLDLSLIGFKEDNKYNDICDIYLLEKQDLSNVAELSMNCFYESKYPSIELNDSIMRKNVLGYIKYIERMDSYLSNYLGFWNRGGRRLSQPSIDISIDSLILVAIAKKSYKNDGSNSIKIYNSNNFNVEDFVHNSTTTTDNTHTTNTYNTNFNVNNNLSNMISVIELGLELPNGLLPPPLKNPLSYLYVKNKEYYQQRQPYLSNLCVSKNYRRLGIGRYMCRIVEYISLQIWKKDQISLHVEDNNDQAMYLYTNLGYSLHNNILTEKEKIMNDMQNILYYTKKLEVIA